MSLMWFRASATTPAMVSGLSNVGMRTHGRKLPFNPTCSSSGLTLEYQHPRADGLPGSPDLELDLSVGRAGRLDRHRVARADGGPELERGHPAQVAERGPAVSHLPQDQVVDLDHAR